MKRIVIAGAVLFVVGCGGTTDNGLDTTSQDSESTPTPKNNTDAYCAAHICDITWQQPNLPNQALYCQMQSLASSYGYNGTISGSMSSGGSSWMGIQRMLKERGFMSSTATVDGIVDSQMYKAMQKAGNSASCNGVTHPIDGNMDPQSWSNWACYVKYSVCGV